MTKDTKIDVEIVDKNCSKCGRAPNWRYMDKFPHKKITTTSHILSGCPFIEVRFDCISCADQIIQSQQEKKKKSDGFFDLGSLFTSGEVE